MMIRLMLLLTILFITHPKGEVRLCGVIKDDILMQPKGNPYIISGTILIPARTSITVMPGVVIKIEKNKTCTATVDHPLLTQSDLPAIIVRGRFDCIGTHNNRITIGPEISDSTSEASSWYGIVFESERSSSGTIAFAEIRGALRAITTRAASPLIRNNLIVNNHIGVFCEEASAPFLHNNNIMFNRASGVLITSASPRLSANLIAYNLAGVTSDRHSNIDMRNNGLWKNVEGHFIECPPEYGLIKDVNSNKDSCDYKQNIFFDPVFMGSASHRDSIGNDIRVATDTAKADVANKKLSRVIVESIPDSVKRDNEWKKPHKPWQFSRYSKLINAGIDKSAFKDSDGSTNDVGMYGGTDILPTQKKK